MYEELMKIFSPNVEELFGNILFYRNLRVKIQGSFIVDFKHNLLFLDLLSLHSFSLF